MVSSASGPFTCNIYDDTGTKFNQNPLPTSQVTVTLALPDKVGVGGAVSGLVKMDPGPLNGPIKLPAGTVNFAATLSVAGGNPSTVQATGGPNAADILPDTASVSPNMPVQFTATAGAGQKITVGVTQVEVRASSPSKLTTRCVPANQATAGFATVDVVAGTVTAPPGLTAAVQQSTATNSSSGSSTSNGFANCAAAKAAGRGTIVKTDPAYRTWLDADGDGLACEAAEVKSASLAATGTGSGSTVAWSLAFLVVGAGLVALGRKRSIRPALAESELDGSDRDRRSRTER